MGVGGESLTSSHVIHPTGAAVSREHRRSKTDRLDAVMRMRVFPWLVTRGMRHCEMVAIPTLAEEDARRPSREREKLVGEKTHIIITIKTAMQRLGIRRFNIALRRAPKDLDALVTPEGEPLPQHLPSCIAISGLGGRQEPDRCHRRRAPGTVGADLYRTRKRQVIHSMNNGFR